jgi:antitoxin (DNA-binding transcriptional repressor) of toxin-antitoxin stability system
MEAVKVGVREFRENLAEYLLETDSPVVVTRHGETVGYYFPAPRTRTEEEKKAFDRAAARLDKILAAQGVTEDELVEKFKRLRRQKHK